MWWYRLRGWKILGENVWAGGNELDLIVRRGRTLRFVEVKEKKSARFGDPLEMLTAEKQRRAAPRGGGLARRASRARAPRRRLRRDRGARRPRAARSAGVLKPASKAVAWPSRRTSCTRRWTSTSPGRRRELPERERTKHVHRLHPYHGKFIPQLVEVLLDRYLAPGDHVLDPFAGSGTTLVQALESGLDATGVDIAAFNCLLMRVKTAPYDLPGARGGAAGRVRLASSRCRDAGGAANGYLREWYAPRAAAELLDFRELIPEYRHSDVLRVILSRAARSARRAAHFDLEAPKEPQRGEYWCHKHRRECRPVESRRRLPPPLHARHAGPDREVRAASATTECEATVLHGDARELDLRGPYDAILTSPPYPGLIDYHEQHRYAYELLELDDRREREIGAAASGTSLRRARGVPQRHRSRPRNGRQ